MNEEIHDSSNIPLCISSQNDTTYYINLESDRRRFTVLGKMSSSKECQKGLGHSYPPQRGAWRRGQPPQLPAELRKRAGKWARGPGTSVPHGGRGNVGVGCLKKEKSPGLPKPSVWVESRPLIIHLHLTPHLDTHQTRGFIAFIRF